MDKNIDSELRSKFEQLKKEADNYTDPLDYIEQISAFIKELMHDRGTNEILLAIPNELYEPDTLEELIEEIKAEDEDEEPLPEGVVPYSKSLSEIEKNIKNNEFVEWCEPHWIKETDALVEWTMNFDTRHQWISPTIIRIGIIEREPRFTWQVRQSYYQHDLWDNENIGKESGWLKFGNVSMVRIWIDIVDLLLNCEDIWTFTSLFPQLHKLPIK